MKRMLSDRELHALYCPVKNTKSALFLVACFSITTFVNWRGLYKAPEGTDMVELLFAMIVVVMLAKWLVSFTCFRERLVFGLVIVNLVTGQAGAFIPSVFGPSPRMLRYGHFSLSLLGLLVSLTMLVHSARGSKIEHDESQRSNPLRPKRNLLVLLTVMLTVLALGAIFVPFPVAPIACGNRGRRGQARGAYGSFSIHLTWPQAR